MCFSPDTNSTPKSKYVYSKVSFFTYPKISVEWIRIRSPALPLQNDDKLKLISARCWWLLDAGKKGRALRRHGKAKGEDDISQRTNDDGDDTKLYNFPLICCGNETSSKFIFVFKYVEENFCEKLIIPSIHKLMLCYANAVKSNSVSLYQGFKYKYKTKW